MYLVVDPKTSYIHNTYPTLRGAKIACARKYAGAIVVDREYFEAICDPIVTINSSKTGKTVQIRKSQQAIIFQNLRAAETAPVNFD